MKTLLIDCYCRDSEKKIPPYLRVCRCFSEVRVKKWNQLKFNEDLKGIDRVIISGSQWMISEKEPPSELKEFIQSLAIPTLGICFGHQLLARSFGAEVKRGEDLIERNETIKILENWEIFTGLGKMSGELRTVVMRESHQEFVQPESIKKIGWQIGAVSESCPVEAIRHPTLPLYGVQFHPERSGINGEKLFENFYRLIGRSVSDNP